MIKELNRITTTNPTVFGVGAFYDITRSFIVHSGEYILSQTSLCLNWRILLICPRMEQG